MKTVLFLAAILFFVFVRPLGAQSHFYFGIGSYLYQVQQKDYVFYPDRDHRGGATIEMVLGSSKYKTGRSMGWIWETAIGLGTFDRRFEESLAPNVALNWSAYTGAQWSPLASHRLHLHAMAGVSSLHIAGQKPESYTVTSQPTVIYYGTDPSSAALAAYYNQLAQQPHLVSIQGFPAYKRFGFGFSLGMRYALALSSAGKGIDLYWEYTPVFAGGVRHDWRAGIGFRL